MIPLVIFKKILLLFAPFVLFYFLRRISKQKSNKKSHRASIDKSKIVEGEVVPDDHLGGVHSATSEVNDGKTR